MYSETIVAKVDFVLEIFELFDNFCVDVIFHYPNPILPQISFSYPKFQFYPQNQFFFTPKFIVQDEN